MNAVRFYTIIHFLRGITQERGPFKTYEEAVDAGESEREHHRHRPLYYTVEKRFVYPQSN